MNKYFLGAGMPKPTYGPTDIQQRTLVRQLFVDVIIFVENVSMVLIAKETMCQDLYLLSVKIIVVAYLAAIVLKIAFYLWYRFPLDICGVFSLNVFIRENNAYLSLKQAKID